MWYQALVVSLLGVVAILLGILWMKVERLAEHISRFEGLICLKFKEEMDAAEYEAKVGHKVREVG
jgi:hypothetical protein